MAEISVDMPVIELDAMPPCEQDTMCRVIIHSIRRLLEDERNRADFEEWKQSKHKTSKHAC